ncbi:uncharacterized protein LOC121386889 [Gigantopelta aegis]|uniref:uncharacterized protein LOC121386889 n=1 Tax=Gigantopelta aegis TaxID=1735272 RepID=UPI001B88A50E|nr:uncharacterized protein LOC121386889 [Gigantopelta aegis]
MDLSCRVTGGNPLVSRVKLECGSLEETRHRSVTDNSVIEQLVFVVRRRYHNKMTCQCKATHRAQYSLTAEVKVLIDYAPSLTLNITANPQTTTLELTCVATGSPANYTFSRFAHYYNSRIVRLLKGRRVAPDRLQLTIGRYSVDDDGDYQCTAANDVSSTHITRPAFLGLKPMVVEGSEEYETVVAVVGRKLSFNKTVLPTGGARSWNWTDQNRCERNQSSGIYRLVPYVVFNVSNYRRVYTYSIWFDSVKETDFGRYTLTVCNKPGCSYFYTDVMKAALPYTESKILVPVVTSAVVAVVALVVIVVVVFVIVRKRRRSRKHESYDVDRAERCAEVEERLPATTGMLYTADDRFVKPREV